MSATATALNEAWLRNAQWASNAIQAFGTAAAFKLAAIPLSILMLFLVYWLVPNDKMPVQRILASATYVGLLLEGLKWLNLLVWPWLSSKLYREYGPFRRSVAIILFSFFAAMLVMAGAEWASRPARETSAAPPEPVPAKRDGAV